MLLGQTTGGDQQAINGGHMLFLRLPNSRIEVDIPVLGRRTQGVPEGGIEPDYAVARTLQGLRNGQDEVLQFGLNRIDKQRADQGR
jgi:hypothetical protein